MSTPAWAVARPEKRVREFFSAPLKSAAADLDQTLEPRGENPAGGYDFASGVCKYLYAHNNPVNRIDPSGRSVIGDVLLSAQIQLYLFAISTAPVATFAKAGLANLTLAAAIHDPGNFVSMMESPSAAANLLAANVAFAAYYGKRSAQFVSGYIAAKTEVGPAVEQMFSLSAERIRTVDPYAVVGFRGSSVRGQTHTGARFNLGDFDVDAFIVSDMMAARIGSDTWFRTASEMNFPEILKEQQALDSLLRAQFKGLRNEPFTFRVYTSREFLGKASSQSHVLTGGGQVLE